MTSPAHSRACKTALTGGLQRRLGAGADQPPFFLGKGGVDVQHEWVDVRPELGHNGTR